MKHQFIMEDFDEKIFKRFDVSVIKFPVDFWTTEGGEFLGDLFTDGSFGRDGSVSYSNSKIENILSNLRSTNKLFTGKILDIQRIKKKLVCCKDLQEMARELNAEVKNFGIPCNVRFRENTKVFEITYSRILKVFLDRLKIPRGKRTITNPELPDVIRTAPNNVIRSFLRRVISNEATITYDGQVCIRQVVLSSHNSPKLLEGCRILFRRFNIKTTRPRVTKKYSGKYGVHVVWEIYTRPYDLSKIMNKIGIEMKEKRAKAERFLENVKRFRLTKEERIQQILRLAKKIGRPFTVYDLLGSIDLKRTAIQNYLYLLMKRGLITRNVRKFYPNGSEPFYYRLIQKGGESGNSSNSL